MDSYIKLALAALLPAAVSAILYLLDKKTAFGRLDNKVKQVVYGVVFGGIAILGTEFGVPINGAQMNCRDAAVITAGLMFGSPAGIIAGTLGAIERWFAVYWGVGSFTRAACTLSTFAAGIYAAVLRKFMFENRRPSWLISCAIGVIIEVFHLTMVFITNIDTPIEAMAVVKACTLPMLVSNGLSVMAAGIILSLLAKERTIDKPEKMHISQIVQRWLLVTVLLAFAVTSYFVYTLQTRLADAQTESALDTALDNVSLDIHDAADRDLLAITRQIAGALAYPEDTATGSLHEKAVQYGVAEITFVNKAGVIEASSDASYIGFDMKSGEQSSEFLCLLEDTESFVQQYGQISSDSSVFRKYAGAKTAGGFIQVGYDADQFQKNISSHIADIAANRTVGSTGYIVIFDEAMDVVSLPKHLQTEDFGKPVSGDIPEQAVTFVYNVNGEDCYCRYIESEGYFIVAMLPVAEAMQTRNIALYVNTFMEILVFAVLFALIYLLIKKVIVDRLGQVNRSLAKITDGDLDETVRVRSSAEFASLSDDINSTVSVLKSYIAEASARIDRELEVAKNIQSSALPNIFPAFPKRKDFDIFAMMDPAKEVGGDFYDFYMTGSDTLHFLIADVSGKGIPAAMFMMRAKTELKSLTENELPIEEVFTQGNTALYEGNDAGMFVTAWQGGIDLTSGVVRYANAGHNPPLIKRAGGSFEFIRPRPGFVLAGMEGVKYKMQELTLCPGDELFLYTDGVTEATNADGELYGDERLAAALNGAEYTTMQELCEKLRADVDAFVGSAPQFDDITMLAFRFFGEPPVPTVHFDEAKLEDITAVTDFIEKQLSSHGCPMKIILQINVAIDELFSNIVRYGYPDKPGPVTVSLIEREDPDRVYIRFSDEGVPYNPLTKTDPDVTLSADEREIGGLGIFIVKKTMDDIKYKYENGCNVLTIMKEIPAAGEKK